MPKRARESDDFSNPFGIGLGDEDVQSTIAEPLDIEDVIQVDIHDCYGCRYLHDESLRKNPHFKKIMELYTQNAMNNVKDAMFRMIKEYFDVEIKPLIEILKDKDIEKLQEHMEELEDNDSLGNRKKHTLRKQFESQIEHAKSAPTEWTFEQIKEHFLHHTNFPSDDINNHLRILRGLHNKILNEIVVRNAEGRISINEKNFKYVLDLEDRILKWRLRKKDIPNMIGYSQELNY